MFELLYRINWWMQFAVPVVYVLTHRFLISDRSFVLQNSSA